MAWVQMYHNQPKVDQLPGRPAADPFITKPRLDKNICRNSDPGLLKMTDRPPSVFLQLGVTKDQHIKRGSPPSSAFGQSLDIRPIDAGELGITVLGRLESRQPYRWDNDVRRDPEAIQF